MESGWGAAVLPGGLAVVTLALLATRAMRADGVAVLALVFAVAGGLVPADRALDGFANPVVVTVAALAVLAAAVHRSGIVDVPRSALARRWRLTAPVLLASGIGVALLAAISGRVGTRTALARVFRLEENGERAGLPGVLLNGACLLGGTLTVAGGLPNLLVSAVRSDQLGEPFGVLDFLPAGAILLGVGLVLTAGGAVLTRRGGDAPTANPTDQLRRAKSFSTELAVPPGSPLTGRTVAALEAQADHAFRVTALVREGFRRFPARPDWALEAGDVVVLDCEPGDLHRLLERFGVQPADGPLLRLSSLTGVMLAEAVVTQSSELIGRPPPTRAMLASGLHLLGIGRNDDHLPGRLRRTKLRAGDILVLAAETDSLGPTLAGMGCLTLAERRLRLGQRRLAALPLVILLAALAIAAAGLLPLWLATLAGVLALVLCQVVPLSDTYEIVPWPGLVMLASLLPLASALHESAAAQALVDALAPYAVALPTTGAIAAAIAAAMIAAELFGSVAAILLMAPFIVALATAANQPTDALLMAVAVGASVDMLDQRGPVAALVPPPGRRIAQGRNQERGQWRAQWLAQWRWTALATMTLLLCGTAAIRWVWGA